MSETIFGIHGAALELRSQRMGVIASNIANAATPGFKARDIDFGAALEAKLSNARGEAMAFGEPELLFRQSTMPSLDGNTVELGREQVAFAENALIGKYVTIGTTQFYFAEPVGRCAAIEVDPDTAIRRKNLVQDLRDAYGHEDMGVFATIVKSGTIACGDEVITTTIA